MRLIKLIKPWPMKFVICFKEIPFRCAKQQVIVSFKALYTLYMTHAHALVKFE